MAWKAIGTTFKIANVAVGELRSLTGPGVSRDAIDVTHHGVTDMYKLWLPTLLDGGEVKIVATFGGINRANIETHLKDDTTAFVITWPQSPAQQASFNGFIKNFEIDDAKPEGELTLSCTIKISGAVTWSGGPSIEEFIDEFDPYMP